MRRYGVVSGTIFILSIVPFVLAAPVLVQEKRQASADVVHTHKGPITVLGKRGDEELARLVELFKAIGKSAESSDAHASSSSVPSASDHGPTNVVQEPPPGPASSTANPDPYDGPYHPSIESSGPSLTAPMQGSWENQFNAAWE